MATHLDRKTLKEDAFRDWMFWALDWVYQRRRWFIAGGSALLLVVAAGAGYYYYHRAQVREQTERFYQAERSATNPELEPAERSARARKSYEAFATEFPASPLAPVAWMHVAQLAWEQGDVDAARKAYQAVLARGGVGAPQQDLARIGLAKLDESQGNLAGAAEQVRAVSDTPYEELKALSLGRIASAQQQNAEARQFYEKAARSTSGSELGEWARQNLDYHP
jgi:predicted negative regulator of RcsB-dependent stress response